MNITDYRIKIQVADDSVDATMAEIERRMKRLREKLENPIDIKGNSEKIEADLKGLEKQLERLKDITESGFYTNLDTDNATKNLDELTKKAEKGVKVNADTKDADNKLEKTIKATEKLVDQAKKAEKGAKVNVKTDSETEKTIGTLKRSVATLKQFKQEGRKSIDIKVTAKTEEAEKRVSSVFLKSKKLKQISTGTINIKAEANLQHVVRRIDNAGKRFKRLKDATDKGIKVKVDSKDILGLMRDLSIVGAQIKQAFGLIINGIRQTTGFASTLQDIETRFTNMYGSAKEAAQTMAIIKQIAATTPYDVISVGQAAAQLQAFGADARATLKSVADLAAYMGTDIVYAAASFGRAFAGGMGAADVLRERGIISMIREINNLSATAEVELPAFRKMLIEAMENPTKGIAGATDRLSKNFSGAVSNMRDSLIMLGATIGEMYVNILQPLAGTVQKIATLFTKYPNMLNATAASITALSIAVGILTVKQILLNVQLGITAALLKNWHALAAAAAVGFTAWYLATDREEASLKKLNTQIEKSRSEIKALKKELESKFSLQELKNELKVVTEELESMYYDVANGLDKKEDAAERTRLARRRISILQAIAGYKDVKEQRINEFKKGDAERWKLEEDFYKRQDALDEYYSKNRQERLKADVEDAKENWQTFTNDQENYAEERAKLYDKFKKLEEEYQEAIKASHKEEEDAIKASKRNIIEHASSLKTLGINSYDTLTAELNEYLTKVKAAFGEESEFYKQEQADVEKITRQTLLRMSEEKAAFVRRVNTMGKNERTQAVNNRADMLKDLKQHFAQNTAEYRKYYLLINEYTQQQLNELDEKELRQAIATTETKIKLGEATTTQLAGLWDTLFKHLAESYGKDSAEYANAQIEQRNSIQQAATDQAGKYAIRQQDIAEAGLNAISTGFNDMFGDMLKVQAKSNNALARGFASMASSFINAIQQMIIKWLAFKALTSIFGVGLFHFANGGFVPQLAGGGLLNGPSHAGGGININAEGGEYVTRSSRTSLALPLLDFINNGPIAQVQSMLRALPGSFAPITQAPKTTYATGGLVGRDTATELLTGEVRELAYKIGAISQKVNVNVSDSTAVAVTTKIDKANAAKARRWR